MKQQYILAMVIALSTSVSAQADGFLCIGKDTGVQFKIFNKVKPTEGTRKVNIMVVSDSKVNAGNKTIAVFSDLNSTLASSGSHYTAKVDLRYSESSRAGENIAGTKLGELATIRLDVLFNYFSDTPSYDGEAFKGKVEYLKHNGQVIKENADCLRYLKY